MKVFEGVFHLIMIGDYKTIDKQINWVVVRQVIKGLINENYFLPNSKNRMTNWRLLQPL
jgi:hypothetical protein